MVSLLDGSQSSASVPCQVRATDALTPNQTGAGGGAKARRAAGPSAQVDAWPNCRTPRRRIATGAAKPAQIAAEHGIAPWSPTRAINRSLRGCRVQNGAGTANFLAILDVFGYTDVMNMLETISIDVYPWAAPTKEQRAW
ncbi:MAG: hypothetical protein SXG53_27110, partial [Pseudomonadota bacterium]|nr:hypothetical protein [Pseudomonadota bacterium]